MKNKTLLKSFLIFISLLLLLVTININTEANSTRNVTVPGPGGFNFNYTETTSSNGTTTLTLNSITCGSNCNSQELQDFIKNNTANGGSGLPSSCPECFSSISSQECLVCAPTGLCLWGIGGDEDSNNINIFGNFLVNGGENNANWYSHQWIMVLFENSIFTDDLINSNNTFISKFYQINGMNDFNVFKDSISGYEYENGILKEYADSNNLWTTTYTIPNSPPSACNSTTTSFPQSRTATRKTSRFTLATNPIYQAEIKISHWYAENKISGSDDFSRFMWDSSIRREPINGYEHFPITYFTHSKDVLVFSQRITPSTYHWARQQDGVIENIAKIGGAINNQEAFDAVWDDLLDRINQAEQTSPPNLPINSNVKNAIKEGGLFRINGIETRSEVYMCASRLKIEGERREYNFILEQKIDEDRMLTRTYHPAVSSSCQRMSGNTTANCSTVSSTNSASLTQTQCNNRSGCTWNSGSSAWCTQWSNPDWYKHEYSPQISDIGIQTTFTPPIGECAMTFTNQFQSRDDGNRFSRGTSDKMDGITLIHNGHFTSGNFNQELHLRTYTTRGNVSIRERRQLVSAACQPLMENTPGNTVYENQNLFQIKLTNNSRRPTSTADFNTSLPYSSLWNSGSFSHTNNQRFFTEVEGCQWRPDNPNDPPWHPSIPNTPNDDGFLCTSESNNGSQNARNNQLRNRENNNKFGGQAFRDNTFNLNSNNWDSDSIFTFFRNNRDNTFRIDVWYPLGENIGGHNITYPATFTSIVFDPNGTPEPDDTKDTMFRFYSPDTNDWNGIGGFNGQLLSPNGIRINGEINQFRTRASWASEAVNPHKFNMLWLNEVTIDSASPVSIRTSSGSNGSGGGITGVENKTIGLDLICPAIMNSNEHQSPVIFRRTANPDVQFCGSNHTCRNQFLNEQLYTDGHGFCSSNRSLNQNNCPRGHWVGTRKIQINFVRSIGE